jgi:DNA-binding transcriptional ArsR family regulator
VPISKHDTMVALKWNQKLQTRRLILSALFEMDRASSNEIHEHITNKIRKSSTKSNPIIDARGFETFEHANLENDKSLRTVQRHLGELYNQELVIKEGRLYALANPLRANRFFGPKFGARVLDSLIGRPDYELKTVKQNLEYLIRLFGTIVTFCCMEAARPKSNFNIPGKGSKEEQLMSTISWINSVISPASLFHYFMFVFKNQVDDEMIPKLTKVNFTGKMKGKKNWMDSKTGKEYNFSPIPPFIDDNGNPYYVELYRDIPFVDEYLHLDRYSYVYADYEPPLDEVKPPQTYTRLVNAFKELVPEFSSKLEELRTDKKHAADFLVETR